MAASPLLLEILNSSQFSRTGKLVILSTKYFVSSMYGRICLTFNADDGQRIAIFQRCCKVESSRNTVQLSWSDSWQVGLFIDCVNYYYTATFVCGVCYNFFSFYQVFHQFLPFQFVYVTNCKINKCLSSVVSFFVSPFYFFLFSK